MRSSCAAVGWLVRAVSGASSSFLPAAASAPAASTAVRAVQRQQPPVLQLTKQQQPAFSSTSTSNFRSSLLHSLPPTTTAQQQHHQQQRQHQQQHVRAMSSLPELHSTTILCIRKGTEVVIMGDGQATQGDFVVKPNVKKVRRIGASAVGGFAGVAVDGLSLLERLEGKLEEHPGQLQRAAVELAKMWRQDKLLRELDASLIVADATGTFWLMGNGDVLETEADGVIGIGSGADFAESAARALLQLQRDLQQQQQQQDGHGQQEGAEAVVASALATAGGGAAAAAAAGGGGVPAALRPVLEMSLFDVATAAMSIAAESCIYTNSNLSWQHIRPDGSIESGDSSSSDAAAGG